MAIDAVFKWKCLYTRCPAKGKLNYRIANSQSANNHAMRYRGHNVAVIKWTPNGDELVEVIQFSPKPDYKQEAGF